MNWSGALILRSLKLSFLLILLLAFPAWAEFNISTPPNKVNNPDFEGTGSWACHSEADNNPSGCAGDSGYSTEQAHGGTKSYKLNAKHTTGGGSEQLSNGGFETGSISPWATNSGTSKAVVQSPDPIYEGTYAGKFWRTSGTGQLYHPFVATVTDTVSVRVRTYKTATMGGAPTMQLYDVDAASTVCSGILPGTLSIYVTVTCSGSITSGGNYRVYVQQTGFSGGGVVFVDDVSVAPQGTTIYDAVEQSVTGLDSTKTSVAKCWLRDNSTVGYGTLVVSTAQYGGGTTICSSADTASNQNTWNQLSCNMASGYTSAYISIQTTTTAADNTDYVYTDDCEITQNNGSDVLLTLPSGSSGRKISLYNASGSETYTAIAGDTSATFTAPTTGTYFWRLTDTDGSTFRDNSAFVMVTQGDTWAWTDANLAKDVTWGFVITGDNNSDGDCTDPGEYGCGLKLQRAGSDYAYFGNGFGTDAAQGVTITASTGSSPGNANDGNLSTYWLSTTAADQWLCLDLGSAQTRNAFAVLTNSSLFSGGITNAKIQTHPLDQSCGSGEAWADVTGSSTNSYQGQPVVVSSFSPQTKRYWRLYLSTNSSGYALVNEIKLYNESTSNNPAAMMSFDLTNDSGGGFYATAGFTYDSYSTQGDGSKTLVKNVSGLFNFSTNVKTFGNTIRARHTISSTADAKMTMRSSLLRYATSNCYHVRSDKADSAAVAACASLTNDGTDDRKGFQAIAFGYPYQIGIVPDSGCRAGWINHKGGTAWQSDSGPPNREITGLLAEDNWYAVYTTNSKEWSNGNPDFRLLAGQTYEFDVVYFRSLDPRPYAAQKAMEVSLATAKEKNLNDDEKSLWSEAFQDYMKSYTDPAYCFPARSIMYSVRGLYPWEGLFTTIGLDDADVGRQVLWDWRKGVFDVPMNTTYGRSELYPKDSLNNSPPSLTGGKRSWVVMSILLGHAIRKGWVYIGDGPECPSKSCVTSSERDALYTVMNNAIPANGEVLASVANVMSWIIGALDGRFSDAGRGLDLFPWTQGARLIAYKSAENYGITIDQTKLTNLKNLYTGGYDATDGYIHPAKYGHWRPISDAGASGGQYYEGFADPVTLYSQTTVRFVVPSGHTNASLAIHYRTDSDYGMMLVKKNGIAVTGTGFTNGKLDLYSASPAFTSATTTETVSTGDVITLQVVSPDEKNASSTSYAVSFDKLVIGSTTYEENDAGGGFQCGSLGNDCFNGYTRGWWKRGKAPGILLWEFLYRIMFNEKLLTDTQVRSHIEHMVGGNQGHGTFRSPLMTYQDRIIPNNDTICGGGCPAFNYTDYVGDSCGNGFPYTYADGGSFFFLDTMMWRLASAFMTDNTVGLWYKWDEKSDVFFKTGSAWTSETDAANYYLGYVEKASSAGGSFLELKNVAWSDAEVNMITGSGQGSVKIYYDNGSGYDAGTTVDLSTASNPIYTKSNVGAQCNGGACKLKFEWVSGTVRLDFVRAKSSPSYMLSQRIAEEYYVEPHTNEWVVTDINTADYRYIGTCISQATHEPHNIFYKGQGLTALQGGDGVNPGINHGVNRLIFGGVYECDESLYSCRASTLFLQ